MFAGRAIRIKIVDSGSFHDCGPHCNSDWSESNDHQTTIHEGGRGGRRRGGGALEPGGTAGVCRQGSAGPPCGQRHQAVCGPASGPAGRGPSDRRRRGADRAGDAGAQDDGLAGRYRSRLCRHIYLVVSETRAAQPHVLSRPGDRRNSRPAHRDEIRQHAGETAATPTCWPTSTPPTRRCTGPTR